MFLTILAGEEICRAKCCKYIYLQTVPAKIFSRAIFTNYVLNNVRGGTMLLICPPALCAQTNCQTRLYLLKEPEKLLQISQSTVCKYIYLQTVDILVFFVVILPKCRNRCVKNFLCGFCKYVYL